MSSYISKVMDLGVVVMFILGHLVTDGETHCYFNPEWIGEYALQVPPSNTLNISRNNSAPTLSHLSIEADVIPILGECHHKHHSNYILIEKSGAHDNCYRCISIISRSSNVLTLKIRALEACYVKAEQARKACPDQSGFASSYELILVRSKDVYGVFCPFVGSFRMTNSVQSSNCHHSKLSNCQGGNELQIKTYNCDKPTLELQESWQCLAHWSSPFPGKFLAIFRTSSSHYLCAVYMSEFPGNIQLSISEHLSDCTTWKSDNFRTFQLQKLADLPDPTLVRKSTCQFPEWFTSSRWENLKIGVDNSSIIFENSVTLKRQQSHCIQPSLRHSERYLIYTKDACGKGHYNCLWIHRRTQNVLEIQYGRRPSTVASFELCDTNNFWAKTWITIAKTQHEMYPACPVAGDYSGQLIDNPDLCAKLSTNCEKLDRMSFVVTSCSNDSDVIETREYQCLGQWEDDGQLMAYVRRTDVQSKFECFVGATDENGQVFLLESGFNCQRNLRAHISGMKLTEEKNCFGIPTPKGFKPWFVPDLKNSRNWPRENGKVKISVVKVEDIETLNSVPIKDLNGTSSASSSFGTLSQFLVFWICVAKFFQF